MASSSSSTTSGGIGLCGLLTILFVVLKFDPGGHLTTEVVGWSWWWVFSPMWIPLSLVAGVLVVIGIIVLAGLCLTAIAALWANR